MSEFDAGMGTTPDMWQMLSELVDGKKLPESLNKALYALCDGKATVVLDASLHYQMQLKHIPYGET